MASVIYSGRAEIFIKSEAVFAEKAPITANTASVATAFFESTFSEDLDFEVRNVVSKIDAKIIEGMQWGYWKKVASAVKNFFVHGFSWEKAVSSPHLLFRSLSTGQKLAFLDNLESMQTGSLKQTECNLVLESLKCEIKYSNPSSLDLETALFAKFQGMMSPQIVTPPASGSLLEEEEENLNVEQSIQVSVLKKTVVASAEFYPSHVKELLQKYGVNDLNDLPVLDLSIYDRSVDYISRINDKDMSASIMRFIDPRGGLGIAFAVRPKEDSKNISFVFAGFDFCLSGRVILYMQHTDEASESCCWIVRAGVSINSIYTERQRGEKGITEKKDDCDIGNPKPTYDIGIKELEALLSGTDPDFVLEI